VQTNKGGGSRKIGRHARVAVKDTILRDENGAVMTHKAFMNKLGLQGGFVFAHGTPQKKPR